MRPFLLNCFTVRSPNAFRKVEGVFRLTGSTVTRKMKFWDQVEELEAVSIQGRVVLSKTIKVTDRPFTSNIVGYHDVLNSDTFQYARDDIVCIQVSRRLSESLHQKVGKRKPFSSLQVPNSIWHHERVSRAHASDNTRCDIVFG